MLNKNDEEAILAEHGRWVAKLRDTSRLLEQRMVILERRVSALEGHMAELAKMYCKIDAQTSCIDDRITRLMSKIDFLNKLTAKKSHKISRGAK
jgi:uncharacterized coiled-coil protein SlyX